MVEVAAREAGWGKTLPKGRGLGIAAHYSFVSYIAAVVEVAVDSDGRADDPPGATWRWTAAPPSTRIGCARRWKARA